MSWAPNIIGIGRHKHKLGGRGHSTIPFHSIPLFHSTIPFHRSIPLNKDTRDTTIDDFAKSMMKISGLVFLCSSICRIPIVYCHVHTAFEFNYNVIDVYVHVYIGLGMLY